MTTGVEAGLWIATGLYGNREIIQRKWPFYCVRKSFYKVKDDEPVNVEPKEYSSSFSELISAVLACWGLA